MDWQAGDLALCVNVSDRRWNGVLATAGSRFRKGAIYTVAGVHAVTYDGVPGLCLSLVEDTPGRTAAAWRFRKINPLTDAEREEALRELNAPERVS